MTTQTYYVLQSISSGQFVVADEDCRYLHHMTKSLNEATAFSATELVLFGVIFGANGGSEENFRRYYTVLAVRLEEEVTTRVVLV